MANKRLKEKMKRRRNGERSVSERKDGYFQASLMVRGERGYIRMNGYSLCFVK